MATANKHLTSRELVDMALEAIRAQDDAASIDCLREACDRPDALASAWFLLGSHLAQLGRFDQALSHLQKAVDVDPTWSIARFQLGMLHLTQGSVAEAFASWQPLEALPSDPLHHFHGAMKQMEAQAWTQAMESLERGIRLNTSNPALNDDMRRIAAGIERRADSFSSAPAQSPQSDTASTTDVVEHLFLSAYQRARVH